MNPDTLPTDKSKVDQPLTAEEKKIKDDKYAQALLQMAAMEQDLKQSQTPGRKPFISKKMLIYLAVSTILSILSLVFLSHNSKHTDNKTSSDKTSQQLLDSGKYLKDVSK